MGGVGDSLLNLPSHISSPLPRLPRVDTPAFWAFLWFVGFCYLANQWQVSKPKDNPLNEGTDAARAAIAFSFFSIFTWVSIPPSWPPLACPAGPPGLVAFQQNQGLCSPSLLSAYRVRGGTAPRGRRQLPLPVGTGRW